MSDIILRPAVPTDAAALLDIYAPYVTQTAITFEYDVPSVDEFRGRIESTLRRYPYLVAVRDGAPVGYAYTGAFHPRSAYAWAAETSIYLRQDERGHGLGRTLYAALETISRAQSIQDLYACIAYAEPEDEHLTNASARFHERLGYTLAGQFRRCACKFDTWYGMIWMGKPLGDHPLPPKPFRSFPSLSAEELRNALAVASSE